MANKQQSQSNQGSKQGMESMGFLFIAALVLILANVLGHYLSARFDLTENRLYSLSQGSRRLVSELEDDMQITAYFTADLPPPFNATERHVRNMLDEYAAASGGNVQVQFITPDTEEEQAAATAAGVREVQHQVIENDSVSVRTGFRGLVIEYIGDRQVIPVIQDASGLEYTLTRAIRLLAREPLPIGVVSGHGSPTPTKGLTVLRAAMPQYELREVDVAEEIDTDIRALLLIAPTEPLTDTEQQRINQYVMRGGSLGVFGGSMNVSLEGMAPSASTVDTGVNQLLAGWGIRLGSDIVADARCGRVPLRTPLGIPIPVAYPPAPIVVFDETAQEHPSLFRIDSAPFFFTSTVHTEDRFLELGGQVLGRSSEENSWLLTGTNIQLQPRDPREWGSTMGNHPGPHSLMVALEGELPSGYDAGLASTGAPAGETIEAPATSVAEVRVLVAGSGALLRDEFLPNPERSQGQLTGGLALALNSIDWLAQDADLIAIRAKNIEDPALNVPQSIQASEEAALGAQAAREEAVTEAIQTGVRPDQTEAAEFDENVETTQADHQSTIEAWDAKKKLYKWGITVGLPLLFAVFGLMRWQMRKGQRRNLTALRAQLLKGKE